VAGFKVVRNLAIIGPEGHATTKGTKTKSGRRFLPIHSQLRAALKAWHESGWKEKVGRGPKPSDPIFPGRGGRPCRQKSAALLREDLEAAKLPTIYENGEPFEFNDLRHSFASWLASAEVPKETRDRLMGHSAASVGERHYTARDVPNRRDARAVARGAVGVPALPPTRR